MSRSNQWYFTSHFIPEGDLLPILSPCAKYAIISKKNEPDLHLEGLVIFEERKRLSQCLGLFPQAKWTAVSKTGATFAQLMTSIKEGDPCQMGTPPDLNSKGSLCGLRTDWSAFKSDVKTGISRKALECRYPHIFDKYSDYAVEYILINAPSTNKS